MAEELWMPVIERRLAHISRLHHTSDFYTQYRDTSRLKTLYAKRCRHLLITTTIDWITLDKIDSN